MKRKTRKINRGGAIVTKARQKVLSGLKTLKRTGHTVKVTGYWQVVQDRNK